MVQMSEALCISAGPATFLFSFNMIQDNREQTQQTSH